MPGQPFSFIVDARGTGGLGDVIIDIVHDKQSVSYRMEDFGHMQYRVSFIPGDAGKYRVYVYFNGSDVRGSPFSIRVGTQKGSRRSKESTSSLERSKVSSLERRMNGLNVSATERSSPTQKIYTSTAYKSISPTQRGYSPVHQTSPTYKTSSGNYVNENSSSSMYHSTSSLNRTRSPNLNHSPVQRNLHSPSVLKETKEIYSSNSNVYNQHSRSPNLQSPSFIKESKDIYSSSTLNRPHSPNLSPTTPLGSRHSPIIKESRNIYNSGSLQRSRSPTRSPMMYRSATQSPVNRSFSPRSGDKDNGVVDTSSNVRVSSMVGGTSRRDSWDAIAKTRSLLSYGSLESLANLTNNSPTTDNTGTGSPSNFLNNNYKNAQSYSTTKNMTSHTASYSTLQKSSSPDYGTEQKYNNDGQQNTRTHGILKNKNNNYYGNNKGVDTTDAAVHDRYLNNGGSVYVSTPASAAKSSVVATGNALETLPVHRPTTFSIASAVDPNKVSVTVTGKCRCDDDSLPIATRRRACCECLITFICAGPNGKTVPVQRSKLRGLTYTITAEEVGEHVIQVLVSGQHIKGSPFRCVYVANATLLSLCEF